MFIKYLQNKEKRLKKYVSVLCNNENRRRTQNNKSKSKQQARRNKKGKYKVKKQYNYRCYNVKKFLKAIKIIIIKILSEYITGFFGGVFNRIF